MRLRVTITTLVAVALLLGTLFGSDDDFPFGPIRMYATTDALDAPVRDTRVTALDDSGAVLELDERDTGLRRAEVEGRLGLPDLPRLLAEAYARRNPAAPALRRVTIVVTWHELHAGQPTGRTSEETVASWER
ncbi:hypothetical protein Lfu02_26730 [Longispora fulva]|uniref:Uncharacterized protein n=1 Tax=Longispora fulva TaxID=619741 RepID=A0A8J7GIP4_9ACTN|nr:hypothetical protein [Longispora fulva]MBG6138806.1 hypothetical protein [Longispora fulva]GIG58301.1 hypothetical protein Lfu02_26730 [Longispora fulva]